MIRIVYHSYPYTPVRLSLILSLNGIPLVSSAGFMRLYKTLISSIGRNKSGRVGYRRKMTTSASAQRIFQQKLDPLTGNTEWVVIDEGEEGGGWEDSRSPLLAKTSYLDMLNDTRRNRAYYEAIKKTITKPCHVLDIGAGTGLLSMMAARTMEQLESTSSADFRGVVTACESYLPMVKLMRRVLRINDMGRKIHVINKRIVYHSYPYTPVRLSLILSLNGIPLVSSAGFMRLYKTLISSIGRNQSGRVGYRRKMTSSASARRLFQQKLDPLTGNTEWVVIDEGEEGGGWEDSRSPLLAKTSYLDMLNDTRRNRAYYEAIKKKITKPCHVLDIGYEMMMLH
uniref:Uncharacterized protein n=1 Tax=Kalanchoe fedtschenkoi TaxID=63787 RepID=A0A7N0U0Y0_KALFE